MRFRLLVGLLVLLPLSSCVRLPEVTRAEALATAGRYADLVWHPEERHVRHGPDAEGVLVATPDCSLKGRTGDPNASWTPGRPATGMPYKWGGFDTPESFLDGLREGRKAGDIATPAKVAAGRRAVSRESVGIDCSGFVSRCWNIPRQYATYEMERICVPLASWDELRPGDIVLRRGHVMMFRHWSADGQTAHVYEASPIPMWRVNRWRATRGELDEGGYKPWRYRKIRD